MMDEKYIDCNAKPFYDIKPCFPMPSGSTAPIMVPELVNTLGKDFVVAAEGGIHCIRINLQQEQGCSDRP